MLAGRNKSKPKLFEKAKKILKNYFWWLNSSRALDFNWKINGLVVGLERQQQKSCPGTKKNAIDSTRTREISCQKKYKNLFSLNEPT